MVLVFFLGIMAGLCLSGQVSAKELAGLQRLEFQHADGQSSQLMIKTPAGKPDKALVFLHGLTRKPKVFQKMVLNEGRGFFPENTLLAFPVGGKDELKRHASFGWDAGSWCVQWSSQSEYLDWVFGLIEKSGVKQTTVVGYSNGGHLVHELACKYS